MRKKETDLEVIKQRYQKRLDRQNEYNKKKYDHISLVFPAGCKEKILTACKEKGYKNPSEYFKELLRQDGVFLEEQQQENYNSFWM